MTEKIKAFFEIFASFFNTNSDEKKFVFFYNTINIVFFICWFSVTLFCVFHHEIFCDELRPWYIVSENDFFNALKSAVTEGHPFLYYVILFPFAKSGFNLYCVNYISLFFVAAAVFIVLFKSGFNLLLRFLITFSAGMIYFLPVIARSYCLIPLCLFLTAFLYKERNNHPFKYISALILISQIHAFLWGLFAICSGLFFIEKTTDLIKSDNKKIKEYIIIFLILTAYILFTAFCFGGVIAHNDWAIQSSFSNAFAKENVYDLTIPFIFCLSLCLFLFLKSDIKVFLIFSATLIFHCFFCTKVSTGVEYQKDFILPLIWLFCYMIVLKNKETNLLYKKILTIVMNIIFLFIFFNPFFLIYVKDDYKYKFTNTKDVIIYLKNNNIEPENVMFYVLCPINIKVYKTIYNTDKSLFVDFYNREKIISELKKNKSIKYIVVNNTESASLISPLYFNLTSVLTYKEKKCKIREEMEYNDELYEIYTK